MITTTLFLFLSLLLLVQVSSNGDAEILTRVKKTRIFDPEGNLNDWVITGDKRTPCNWTGITCRKVNGSSYVSVTAIDLSGYGISGGFPYGFCRIRTLVNLTLSHNNLTGTIDSQPLKLCSRIRVLILNNNNFTGSLPEFSPEEEFRSLRVLEMESNQFSGEIPESYGRFRSLEVLNLNDNSLEGIVPAFLGNLTELTRLELAFVDFDDGPIPATFGNLTKLSYLRLTQSGLVGEIPDSIGNLVLLENLDLATNGLTGEIPESIGNLESVYQIELFDNRLSGKLPVSIGNLTNLRNLDVSQNNLTGELPEAIAKLQLVSFNLNDNFFTGELPEILAMNPNLVEFKIFNNSFTGKLPRGLGKFSKLSECDFSTNRFSGELPADLCHGGKLERLISFGNRLTGGIPGSYGECRSLNYIRMADNKLSGEVPVKFWELPLTRLELSNNQLQGSIPATISKARHLSQLEISGNEFSGSIPIKICDLGELIVIDLSRNRFSGSLPSCINKLKNLERLEMQENEISGEIPSSVRSCRELTELNLSFNRFHGGIPPELGDLPVLNYLDLSNNELSGEIPSELLRLKLNQFNVSDNKLYGKIPTGFQQDIFRPGLVGNPNLCGPNLDPIRPCRSKPKTRYIIVISVICIVALIGALVWVFIKTKPLISQKPNRTNNVTVFQRVGFSVEEIYPQLTEDNIIGSGGSGLVYRVKLKSGQLLAVKKLHGGGQSQKPEPESVFRSEVETLGRVRHGNIVKLLMCCNGEEFRFLVYEFMENGSLGDVLHSEKEEHRAVLALDWTTRFSIAVGAAQGLAYLHHDCVPAIVHRDVKSNNILLDHEMKPRVADFGLAKPLKRKDNNVGGGVSDVSSMSCVAGSYGYIAPEYGYTLKVNEKSDVYSFGVVLLELITGKRPNDSSFGENKDIVKFAMEKALSYSSTSSPYEQDNEDAMMNRGSFKDLSKLVDPKMKELSKSDYEEIERVLDVALLCTSSFPINRPTMRKVVELLKEKKSVE